MAHQKSFLDVHGVWIFLACSMPSHGRSNLSMQQLDLPCHDFPSIRFVPPPPPRPATFHAGDSSSSKSLCHTMLPSRTASLPALTARATTLRWCVARGSEASAWHGLGRQADDGEERGGGSNIGPEERSTLHCPCVAAALPSDAHLDSKEGRGTCLDLMKVADGGSQSRV